MFRIGEFAQIAQVSTRQLRFYDQLGLLQPAQIDHQTGYRYYTVRQLPRLNSILALKELGLSLAGADRPTPGKGGISGPVAQHADAEARAARALASGGRGPAAAHRVADRTDRQGG
jgi:MerR HTH family regulatory protein